MKEEWGGDRGGLMCAVRWHNPYSSSLPSEIWASPKSTRIFKLPFSLLQSKGDSDPLGALLNGALKSLFSPKPGSFWWFTYCVFTTQGFWTGLRPQCLGQQAVPPGRWRAECWLRSPSQHHCDLNIGLEMWSSSYLLFLISHSSQTGVKECHYCKDILGSFSEGNATYWFEAAAVWAGRC